MSPPSSINGNTMDSFRESRRNRGLTSRQQEELCLVCGDRASGYHYNALTCEGCKGFFRRSITKNAVYQCKYGNSCEIDMYMRRKCQECRLKKCLKVGMRPECVVPEYQCAVKREAKRAQKDKDKPNSTTKDRAASPDPIRTSTTTEIRNPSMDNGANDSDLTVEEEELIQRLVFFQEEFESPSSEDLAKITHYQGVGEDGEIRYKHITEITIYTIRLIVEFAKRVPWFDTLQREDQITLLKACSSEIMMLRTARRYDISTDTIVFATDQPYTRENYNSAGLGECTNAIFHFCRQMCLMKVDNAEYALLTSVVIFSERPNLLESAKVEKIQEIYLEALRKYELKHRNKGQLMFARLLSVLTELRTLGTLNSEMCFSLRLKNKELPPFLAEIWDINS